MNSNDIDVLDVLVHKWTMQWDDIRSRRKSITDEVQYKKLFEQQCLIEKLLTSLELAGCYLKKLEKFQLEETNFQFVFKRILNENIRPL